MTPRLLVLTDRSQLQLGRSLQSALAECAAAGLTHVVLRELDLADRQRTALADRLAALRLKVLAARRWVPGSGGLHLAAHQPGPAVDGLPFGRSCHDAAAVHRAAAEGASWATLSPYAATASKPGHGPPVPGAAWLEAATAAIPVYALGGITPAIAGQAMADGATGVAVMGEVMRSAEPGAVVAALLREVGR